MPKFKTKHEKSKNNKSFGLSQNATVKAGRGKRISYIRQKKKITFRQHYGRKLKTVTYIQKRRRITYFRRSKNTIYALKTTRLTKHPEYIRNKKKNKHVTTYESDYLIDTKTRGERSRVCWQYCADVKFKDGRQVRRAVFFEGKGRARHGRETLHFEKITPQRIREADKRLRIWIAARYEIKSYKPFIRYYDYRMRTLG
jgi:hypothetical protein